eukprot:6723771-Prymnesium_polylepis.1
MPVLATWAVRIVREVAEIGWDRGEIESWRLRSARSDQLENHTLLNQEMHPLLEIILLRH